MTGRKKKSPSVPPEAAAPFFARFLENQYGSDAEAQAGPSGRSLKYPSDRDEIDDVRSPVNAEAAPTEAAPSRMTLKYPSDRDEIDIYSTLHGASAEAP